MEPIYALLAGRCLQCEGKGEEVKNVIVRFDSEEQLEFESDNFFDDVYGSFNAGLPKGWFVDEEPEIYRLIPEEEAIEQGFIVFDRNLIP